MKKSSGLLSFYHYTLNNHCTLNDHYTINNHHTHGSSHFRQEKMRAILNENDNDLYNL